MILKEPGTPKTKQIHHEFIHLKILVFIGILKISLDREFSINSID